MGLYAKYSQFFTRQGKITSRPQEELHWWDLHDGRQCNESCHLPVVSNWVVGHTLHRNFAFGRWHHLHIAVYFYELEWNQWLISCKWVPCLLQRCLQGVHCAEQEPGNVQRETGVLHWWVGGWLGVGIACWDQTMVSRGKQCRCLQPSSPSHVWSEWKAMTIAEMTVYIPTSKPRGNSPQNIRCYLNFIEP